MLALFMFIAEGLTAGQNVKEKKKKEITLRQIKNTDL